MNALSESNVTGTGSLRRRLTPTSGEAYLFGDGRLQFALHLRPAELLQVAQLADDENRPGRRLGVSGGRLELEQHVRHL